MKITMKKKGLGKRKGDMSKVEWVIKILRKIHVLWLLIISDFRVTLIIDNKRRMAESDWTAAFVFWDLSNGSS